MPASETIQSASRKLVPGYGALLDLFICDASSIFSSLNGLPGPVFAFQSNTKYADRSLFFQGVEYQPFPMDISGYETDPASQLPRPRIGASNIGAAAYAGGVLSSVLREFDDLYGAKVIHKRTFEAFLDAQPTHDATMEFEPLVFYVDRKVSEMKGKIVLELGAPFDIEGIKIPRRQMNANSCSNVYRSGDGCDYAGPPATDQQGNLIGPTFTGTFTAGQTLVTGIPVGSGLSTADEGRALSGSKILPGTMVATIFSSSSFGMTVGAISSGSASMTLNRTRDRGAWNAATNNYILNDAVYVMVNNVKTYYVAKTATVAVGLFPRFNPQAWVTDSCDKQLSSGCRVRFGRNAVLPANLFPALGRAPQA
jgi:lambda family phage minor tail protein L